MSAPLIFDAHLDLAMNAMEWNRDLTWSISELRESEAGKTDKPDRGHGTVSFSEMRRGKVGICVATLIARVQHNAFSPVIGWRSQPQAWAQTQGQFAWYQAMAEQGQIVFIRNSAELNKHLSLWKAMDIGAQSSSSAPISETAPTPIGCILSLEGADSIISFKHLGEAREKGLRAIGPAHYGPGVYANGTDSTGGFNAKGRDLLKEMDRLGIILDVTHLCDDCFWEALDLFQGPIWASHQNCRALVPHMRQFSDEQLKALIARGAVIGVALDAWMLVPGWVRGKTTPQSANLTLEKLLDHIDHICQLAGNSRHAGIGSDLDGAFGCEQTPSDLNTIADLSRIPALLANRGYTSRDLDGIAHENFTNFLIREWK
jgi:membrane dipeptidase